MQPHGKSSRVCLSPADHESPQESLDPTAAPEITAFTCAVCGKTGVSICARCSKKGRRYKTALARAHPLQKRDPELYKRLDDMSRLSLQEIKQLWDEFCIEIKAEHFYEDILIFVELLQEGKWRTEALNVRRGCAATLPNASSVLTEWKIMARKWTQSGAPADEYL